MTEHVTIGAAHWVYLLGVLVIVATMIMRANVVVPSILATALVAFAWTHSPVTALESVFNASFTAAKELFNIFLVIALMTALLNALKSLRSDIRMVEPFRAVMKNGHLAYRVARSRHLCDLAVLLANACRAPGLGGAAAGGDRCRSPGAWRCRGDRHRRTGHGAVVRLCDRRCARDQRQGGRRRRQRRDGR